MMNLDTEIYDLMDLISFTLSNEFIEKWRFKYGERILKLFQFKLINSLQKSKVIKVSSLHKYLTKDSGYCDDVVTNFLKDIDYGIYSPIISGYLKKV